MLTEIYIEALLVDEKLADQVWEAWDAAEISNDIAALTWWSIGRTGPIYARSTSSQVFDLIDCRTNLQKNFRISKAFFWAMSVYCKCLVTSTKPNPPKGGDGKPRVLASSEKPWKTPRRTPRSPGCRSYKRQVCHRRGDRASSYRERIR